MTKANQDPKMVATNLKKANYQDSGWIETNPIDGLNLFGFEIAMILDVV